MYMYYFGENLDNVCAYDSVVFSIKHFKKENEVLKK